MIDETVGAAGFTIHGMQGGDTAENGRDFTTTEWKWARIFDGTGAGQVAAIDPTRGSIRGIGFLSIRNTSVNPVYHTTSRIAWDEGASILGDSTLWELNRAAQARIGSVRSAIRDAMGNTAGGGKYLRYDGDITDDSLAGDADDDFLAIPTIFFGRWRFGLVDEDNVAYTPGLANVKVATASLFVFPEQFGATVGGADVYQTATSNIIGAAAKYADDWDLYHRMDGEIHCATAALRKYFTTDWWEDQP